MKDHQLGYTLPLHPLGAKIERHQATPEDRRAMELCKFEQKRHEVEPIAVSADFGFGDSTVIISAIANPTHWWYSSYYYVNQK